MTWGLVFQIVTLTWSTALAVTFVLSFIKSK